MLTNAKRTLATLERLAEKNPANQVTAGLLAKARKRVAAMDATIARIDAIIARELDRQAENPENSFYTN